MYLIPLEKKHLHIMCWFYSTKYFKIMYLSLRYLSKLRPHKKIIVIKFALSEVWVSFYWTYKQICVLNIDAHNDQGCMDVFLSSVKGLKQSALTTRLLKHSSNTNNWKYIDKRLNWVTTGQKIHEWSVKTRVFYVYK